MFFFSWIRMLIPNSGSIILNMTPAWYNKIWFLQIISSLTVNYVKNWQMQSWRLIPYHQRQWLPQQQIFPSVRCYVRKLSYLLLTEDGKVDEFTRYNCRNSSCCKDPRWLCAFVNYWFCSLTHMAAWLFLTRVLLIIK